MTEIEIKELPGQELLLIRKGRLFISISSATMSVQIFEFSKKHNEPVESTRKFRKTSDSKWVEVTK